MGKHNGLCDQYQRLGFIYILWVLLQETLNALIICQSWHIHVFTNIYTGIKAFPLKQTIK